MKIIQTNQYNNPLNNVIFIHYKNNSAKNINFTDSKPNLLQDFNTSKEKLNITNTPIYFNGKGRCLRNNNECYCSKKMNKCNNTPLRKIMINDTALIKSKSSKLITSSENKRVTNCPKNYSYYERKEISSKNEVNNFLINNINNNKNKELNNNTNIALFNDNFSPIPKHINKNKNEFFLNNYMRKIKIINKNNNNSKKTIYNNTRTIKNILIENENNTKKINSIIPNKYFTINNILTNENLNDFNSIKFKNINLNKKIKSKPLKKKECSFKEIRTKTIAINNTENEEDKENMCRNFLPINIEENYAMSEKIDKNNDYIEREKIKALNTIKFPIYLKKNLNVKNNKITIDRNTLDRGSINKNIGTKNIKSYKSFKKYKTVSNNFDNESCNLGIEPKNNSHIKLINKNHIQLNSIIKSKNKINQQEKYKTYTERNSPITIVHSYNEKIVKNSKSINQNDQSESIEHNPIIHKIPKDNKISQKLRGKKSFNLNNITENRKKSYDYKRRINHSFSKIIDRTNYISSNIFIKNIKAQSQAGRLEPHHTKINQDTYLIEQNINGILNFNLFGVLDGHGVDGHHVSKYVAKFLKNKLGTHPKVKYLTDPQKIYQKITENNYKIIEYIFLEADEQIRKEHFDFYLSGTTCVVIIQLEEKIICANCGDSRAILIYENNSKDNLTGNLKNTKIFPLSDDCKPNLPQEKYRIMKSGGTVEKSENEEGDKIGPYRVWEGDKDYPGLAMSRSIGDLAAKKVGVIPNPLIKEYTIDHNSKYLIICSDGVWEFLSNENVMEICNKYYIRNDVNGLCQDLIKKATFWWEKEDNVIDDITVVAVFF